jgi:hypothetical protein
MKLISALALASLSIAATSGVALAGPEATVTFKNNSDSDATYDPVSISAFTYAHADPKPVRAVKLKLPPSITPIMTGLRNSP